MMRQWLEPLPDGSLPNFNIRRDFIDILGQLPIESEDLKESGIGRVVRYPPLSLSDLCSCMLRMRYVLAKGEERQRLCMCVCVCVCVPYVMCVLVKSASIYRTRVDTHIHTYKTNLLQVMFLWKCPKETMENKKKAQDLIERWSRPIFQLSTDYRDLARYESEKADNYRRLK